MTNTLENTGILHAGQMTDHANNADTESGKKLNYLKNNGKISFQDWHAGCNTYHNSLNLEGMEND
ncbi:conserved hypothetical protein [Pseudomonas chlororaphis]